MVDTYVMQGVSVGGVRQTKLKKLFERIGFIFNPPRDSVSTYDSQVNGNTNISGFTDLGDTQINAGKTSNGISGTQFTNALTGIGAIATTVFGFLGQSEQTKQSRYQLEAISKQKELALAQGEIEYQIQKLDADIELKKQELAAAQKADTTKNIIKVVVIFGILSFLGFIIFLVFKRKDSRNTTVQVAAPAPLK